ncbi:MAG TPA: hypothetical protein VFC78_02295 [Tepidisphaeraceae bacterium]|nr:hypothetical protein [Tepidisphaeraceae bacterium]
MLHGHRGKGNGAAAASGYINPARRSLLARMHRPLSMPVRVTNQRTCAKSAKVAKKVRK